MKHAKFFRGARIRFALAGFALTGLLWATQAAAQSPTPPRIEQGNLVFDGIPARSADESAALAHWLESRSAGFVDWLADGGLLITTRFGNTAQLHRVRAPLGMREQLTWEDEPITTATAHPYDADTVIYSKDHGGDENSQLWLRNLRLGTERLLTDGRSRNGPPVFARDGKRVVFSSNARDGLSQDIYVSDTTASAAPRLLVGGSHDALRVQGWSMDDQRIAVIRFRSITDSELLLADVATGALTRIEPAADYKGGTMAVKQARFSRDARGIYFLTDRGGEFTELRYMDLYTHEERTLTPQSRWDVERFDLSADGRYLAYTLNEGGTDRLVLHDLNARADRLLPPLPGAAVISSIGFDPRSQQLAVTVETAQSPADVYVYRLDASQPAVTLARWTQGEIGPIDSTRLVAPQRVEFSTWDRVGNQQRMLSAFVYKPRTPGPHPVVIDFHGGPGSQFRPGWSAFTQYLVNELGYAVVAPDVRGSSGYGRSFLQLDSGELREDAVRDIGSLLVWIGLQPDLNRNRVVAMGGYMALASLVHYGDRLAGGVDVAGVGNVAGFLANTSAYIRKPLLIVQGMNDPRVPAIESEQMMARVRAGGGEVWYLAAKDEGHSFRKKANRDVYLATVAQFLRRLNR